MFGLLCIQRHRKIGEIYVSSDSDEEKLFEAVIENGGDDVEKNDELIQKIKQTSEDQKQYKSEHKYDLKKFDLTEEIIKNDCKKIYDTFLQ